MDSPQSVVSPFKNAVTAEPEKQKTTDHSEVPRKATNGHLEDNFIGKLEVYVHQARDIHNICIYHKQDVYAKICLTSDPENTVSTNTINGGGRNPVFNQNLQINVKTVDCSLKSDNHTSNGTCVANVVESYSAATVGSALATNKLDSPPSSVSATNGDVSSPSNGVNSDNSKTQSEEHNSVSKEDKGIDAANGETDSSAGTPREEEEVTKPVVSLNMEPGQGVVQQDIVDMYMKSMQQFTESLAKMKLPLDIDSSGPASSGSSNSEQQKTPSSTKAGSRVFYGSRAFF
ncbi:unnamed protein product [Linum tenue]|uniref:C2 domain-containing protein n=1 Tax=Linum tenue TaxID=586396 RepID=A0AAV0GNH9_9ROSI|nr:unnamed protein product [Linum tenue]